MKVLLTIYTLAALSCAAYAINCYECSTGSCASVTSSQLGDCNNADITQCKIILTDSVITRTCGASSAETVGCTSDTDGTTGVVTQTCICAGEGCNNADLTARNGAGSAKASVMVSFLLTCLMAKMLF